MGNGLSELLEGAATAELVSVIALQIRTVPDDGAERAAWQQANLRKDAPSLALAVNAELAQVMTQAGVRHEAFVTIVVPEGRIAKQAKEAGGGVDGRARVLYGVMGEVEARLMGPVGCSSVTWLDSPALAAAIRTGFAPGDRAGLTAADIAAQNDPNVASALPMAAAGPTSTPNPERRFYAHDAWHSATCTILLPDKGAVMGALAPVFTPTTAGERRSVTVFFEPISHDKADRMVGNESMSADLAAEMRRKSGFKVRASHRRDAARGRGPRRPAGRRQRAGPSRDRRRGDGAQHLVDHRLRPAAGIQHHRRRVQPAAPGPGPGLRVRRRLHPTRHRAAQAARCQVSRRVGDGPERAGRRAAGR